MKKEEWTKTLWSTGNGITAFAAAQGLAFGYVLGKGDIAKQISDASSRIIIAVISVVAMLIYSIAVYRIGRHGRRLDPGHAAIWREATTGRLVAIAFFTLIPLLGLLDNSASKPCTNRSPTDG